MVLYHLNIDRFHIRCLYANCGPSAKYLLNLLIHTVIATNHHCGMQNERVCSASSKKCIMDILCCFHQQLILHAHQWTISSIDVSVGADNSSQLIEQLPQEMYPTGSETSDKQNNEIEYWFHLI